MHEASKALRVSWVAAHLDAVLAQRLASRAYHALNRVCLGQARRVRFKSRGRGLSSIENKRNDTGLRFELQPPEEGNQGFLVWKDDRLPALIDWHDPVITYGLGQRIKYARLIQRKASSPHAQGADSQGNRYVVQLALEGIPFYKPKHSVGTDTIGADLGPSSIALVPREGAASLAVFCEELTPDARAMRRLQRKLAAHRKSLHGKQVHEIIAVGTTIILEHISYQAWQKQYGKSVGLRAPGMFVAQLKRTVASTGGTLIEVPTGRSKLSQFCHGCGRCVKKPLSQRWHQCACGVGPVQRDLYAAFLASTLDQEHLIPSCARAVIRLLKVRRRACGPHTNGSSNGRMRGRPCPEALVSPEPEPVGLKV